MKPHEHQQVDRNMPTLEPALYIIPTPLGNLGDITYRAVTTLAQVSLIAAEDTRHSRRLLQHYQITTPLCAYHEHNQVVQAQKLIEKIQAGESVALISDAGTPLISDPGYVIVAQARKSGVNVIALPGPNAAICALSASGLATDRFLFVGFPPAKANARLQFWQGLSSETATVVSYEAPHRVIASLQDAATAFGADRHCVLAKELTKQFETYVAGTINEVLAWVTGDPVRIKGEFVLLFQGVASEVNDTSADVERVLSILLAELPLKQAVDLTVSITGAKRNWVYQQALGKP